MIYVKFPTRIRYLCRMRAHLNCFYVSNYNIRGAGSVGVSAYNCHADSLGLIPRRMKPIIFCININRQRLTLLNCAAGGAMLCATHIGMVRT